jgi:uncharacterized protein (TIGR03435 family)
MRSLLLVALILVSPLLGIAQAPAADAAAPPRFDVVSIKRSGGGQFINITRPDGGFTRTNMSADLLVAEAYLPPSLKDVIGLPEWAKSEKYDIKTTSTLARATQEDRRAMLRALLADRFKLAAHFEKREQDVFELVLARRDGRLGAGLQLIDLDCARVQEERLTAAATVFPPPGGPPDFAAPIPPCSVRMRPDRSDGSASHPSYVLEGSGTMEDLAHAIRLTNVGRIVVNKTNLTGSFRFRITFDLMATLAPLRAATSPPSDSGQTVFSAIQEQLGLKLQSSRAPVDTFLIDHLERPSED